MVWHIFKKDWKLLWPLAIAVVGLVALARGLTLSVGLFPASRDVMWLAGVSVSAVRYAWVLMLAIVVLQDAIPGAKQDWLAHPIRKWDLLRAKLLFAALFVIVPFLAASILGGMGDGFPFSAMLAPSVIATVWLALIFVLPVIAAASLFKDLTQGIIAAAVTLVLLLVVSSGTGWWGGFGRSVVEGGLGWTTSLLRLVVVCAGALAILAMQYGSRRTKAARWLAGFVIVLALLVELLPWGAAFALEKRFSPQPGAGSDVALAFDATASGAKDSAVARGGLVYAMSGGAVRVSVPVRIDGVPEQSALLPNRIRVRISSPGTAAPEIVEAAGEAIWQETPATPEHGRLELAVPTSTYRALQNENVKIEADYSLTLFKLKTSYGIPALNGDQRMPGIGWCETRVNMYGWNVAIACMNPGEEPACTSVFLEDAETGQHNVPVGYCHPTLSSGIFEWNAMRRTSWNVFTYDPSSRQSYVVDTSKLPHARAVIRVYAPVDHFTRQLIIPKVKLSDWVTMR